MREGLSIAGEPFIAQQTAKHGDTYVNYNTDVQENAQYGRFFRLFMQTYVIVMKMSLTYVFATILPIILVVIMGICRLASRPKKPGNHARL